MSAVTMSLALVGLVTSAWSFKLTLVTVVGDLTREETFLIFSIHVAVMGTL